MARNGVGGELRRLRVVEGAGDDSLEAATRAAALALRALALRLPHHDPFRRPVDLLAQGLAARLPPSHHQQASP